jgi:hypothetical protein
VRGAVQHSPPSFLAQAFHPTLRSVCNRSFAHLHQPASAVPPLQLLGLFLLVCFGSCMDIAAISSGINHDSPLRLDFNQELTTIGAWGRVMWRGRWRGGGGVCEAGLSVCSPRSDQAAARGARGGRAASHSHSPGLAACSGHRGLPVADADARRTSAAFRPAAGISNMLSGAVGAGFTGSFIFSQTIWSGRAGVTSRLNGAGELGCPT